MSILYNIDGSNYMQTSRAGNKDIIALRRANNVTKKV